MYITRHQTKDNQRWALDGRFLPEAFSLGLLLSIPAVNIPSFLKSFASEEDAVGPLLPPVEPDHEIWASGVTYLRSRQAREAESDSADMYARVYEAVRPELFFKAPGWRVVGHLENIHIRRDSAWNVPEPELTLVINSQMEVVGYCAGNDMSSRDIEGANPLYLPQAKMFNGSCALGPGILLADAEELKSIAIQLEIIRNGSIVFSGDTTTANMKKEFSDLVAYLGSELTFPIGAFLMTGTGIVPPDEFTLEKDDTVRVKIGSLEIENLVAG